MKSVFYIFYFSLKSLKTGYNDFKQHQRVVGADKFLTKIYTAKNYPCSQLYRCTGPFYRVANSY
jgi:hypothetical protein